MSAFDVRVLGGGPAGCAAALFAARAGLRVALFERGRHPRPKVCGEGLMPSGRAVLRELGLADGAAAIGRPFSGVRYVSAAGRRAEGRFPREPGLGVRREDLDLLLWRAASSHPRISVRESDDGAGEGSRLTVVADGGRSKAAESFGVVRTAPARRRFGLSARWRGVEADMVEVHLAAGAELYLTPLSRGEANVAVLVEETALGGRIEAVVDALIASCGLRERLRSAVRVTGVRGLGPLGGAADRVHGDDWLLAGDAAGALDPIIGDGIAAALITGRLAGLAAAAFARGDREALRRYARERETALRSRRWLAAAILAASKRPRLAEMTVAGLAKAPAAFDAALSLF